MPSWLSTPMLPPCCSTILWAPRQADAHARDATDHVAAALEPLEDVRLFPRRNPDAAIADLQDRPAPLGIVLPGDRDGDGLPWVE